MRTAFRRAGSTTGQRTIWIRATASAKRGLSSPKIELGPGPLVNGELRSMAPAKKRWPVALNVSLQSCAIVEGHERRQQIGIAGEPGRVRAIEGDHPRAEFPRRRRAGSSAVALHQRKRDGAERLARIRLPIAVEIEPDGHQIDGNLRLPRREIGQRAADAREIVEKLVVDSAQLGVVEFLGVGIWRHGQAQDREERASRCHQPIAMERLPEPFDRHRRTEPFPSPAGLAHPGANARREPRAQPRSGSADRWSAPLRPASRCPALPQSVLPPA